jgi:hypothetical protein
MQLLRRLTSGRFPIYISAAFQSPDGTRRNQTFTSVGQDRAVCDITRMITAYHRNGTQIDAGAIDAMMTRRYPDSPDLRYVLLEQSINSMPLYSLFVNENRFEDEFLTNHPMADASISILSINGENLRSWLHGEAAAFDDAFRINNAVFEGVQIKKFFLLALVFTLYSASPPGPGSPSRISFNVCRGGDNDPTNLTFRPPAIGLAHELMHAMHYSYGTALGSDEGHFTTTAAELMFMGTRPFQDEPITENMIRSQWATIVAPDPDQSNVWGVVGAATRREAYELPTGSQTVAGMRSSSQMI